MPHSLFVLAVLSGQKGKAVWFEVDQRVPNNQRSAAGRLIKRNLARGCAFDFDNFQIVADGRISGRLI